MLVVRRARWTVRRALLAAGALAAPAFAADPPPLTEQNVGYAVGHDLGVQTAAGLRRDGVAVDLDALAKGFADGVRGVASTLTPEQVDVLLQALHDRVAGGQAEERYKTDPVFRALADENLRRSREFLAAFTRREGAATLPGGAARMVVRSGEGRPAAGAGKVVLTFRVLMLDQTEVARGENIEIDVATMLPASRDAVAAMREGDVWYVVIPAEHGFGLPGRPPVIGPNEALIAEAELVRVP